MNEYSVIKNNNKISITAQKLKGLDLKDYQGASMNTYNTLMFLTGKEPKRNGINKPCAEIWGYAVAFGRISPRTNSARGMKAVSFVI
jgi:hypothetical protein